MFRRWQKVVCVDDSPGRITGRKELTLGNVYTISGYDPEDIEGLGVWVLEVKMPTLPHHKLPLSFRQSRFRPLAERKADMEARRALFTKWQNYKEERVDECETTRASR